MSKKRDSINNQIQGSEVEQINIIARIVSNDGNVTEQTILTINDMSLDRRNTGDVMNLLFPNLEIHLKEQTVYYNGSQIALSRYEFYTLCYLAKHPNWVFSKEQIYEAVWNESSEHCGTAVTNVISQLRRKLKQENPNFGYICTVVGRGYKFVDRR